LSVRDGKEKRETSVFYAFNAFCTLWTTTTAGISMEAIINPVNQDGNVKLGN
jgi:hypothetical protein